MLNSKLIIPKSSTLPPRPINNLSVPKVEKPFDPRGRSQSNAPIYSELDVATSNFLNPPPREQMEDPVSNVKPNLYFLNTPYDTKSCIFKYNPNQMVIGNANFVRGNQFSNNFTNLYNSEKYTVEQPVLEPTNPLMVTNSPFYPYPGFEFRINPDYKTYPYQSDSLGTMPAFKYPYKTTGPISPVIEKFKDIKRKKKRRRKVKENFDTGNVNNEKCALVVIGMAAAIIVITMVAK
jgi:hypothetical protein